MPNRGRPTDYRAERPFDPFLKPGLHHVQMAVADRECWKAMSANINQRHCHIGKVTLKLAGAVLNG